MMYFVTKIDGRWGIPEVRKLDWIIVHISHWHLGSHHVFLHFAQVLFFFFYGQGVLRFFFDTPPSSLWIRYISLPRWPCNGHLLSVIIVFPSSHARLRKAERQWLLHRCIGYLFKSYSGEISATQYIDIFDIISKLFPLFIVLNIEC